jgi:hypothetical protein
MKCGQPLSGGIAYGKEQPIPLHPGKLKSAWGLSPVYGLEKR